MSLRTWAAVGAVIMASVLDPSTVRAQSEPPAAAEPPPATDAGAPLPPVDVVTSPEPAPAAKKSPKKKAPPAPATETAGVPEKAPTAPESPIFGAPAAEGDTLNRGTTGVEGYFAAGT